MCTGDGIVERGGCGQVSLPGNIGLDQFSRLAIFGLYQYRDDFHPSFGTKFLCSWL